MPVVAKVPYQTRGGTDDPEGNLRGMEPFLLLRLAERPSHGYELVQEIAALGFRRASEDPSALYKLLRRMETEGLTESSWSDGAGGPPRRVYVLTRAGERYLHSRADDLRRQAKRITRFVDRYQSWSRQSKRRAKERINNTRADRGR